jgi:hypothetical protein
MMLWAGGWSQLGFTLMAVVVVRQVYPLTYPTLLLFRYVLLLIPALPAPIPSSSFCPPRSKEIYVPETRAMLLVPEMVTAFHFHHCALLTDH